MYLRRYCTVHVRVPVCAVTGYSTCRFVEVVNLGTHYLGVVVRFVRSETPRAHFPARAGGHGDGAAASRGVQTHPQRRRRVSPAGIRRPRAVRVLPRRWSSHVVVCAGARNVVQESLRVRHRDRCVLYTLVPIRPRPRGERRSLRTLPGASLRPSPLAGFNPDTPRRLSTPLLTPFNSTPTDGAKTRRGSASTWTASTKS